MPNHLAPYRPSVPLADLTEKQRLFVEFYVELDGRKGAATEAAIRAGFGKGVNREAAKSRASEMLHHPGVLAAIRDEIARQFSAGAVLGLGTLRDLAEHAKSEQVRLGAARELVDRGYGPVMSRNAPPADHKPSAEDFLANLKIVDGDGQEADDAATGSRQPTPDDESEE